MPSDHVVAVVQARFTSTRLPGKILLPLGGVPLLGRVLERVEAIDGVDAVVVAVPEGDTQTELVDFVTARTGTKVFAGSEQDVLARTLLAAESERASTVVRITSDCPMLDPVVSSTVLAAFIRSGVSYARTGITNGYPLGYETEVIAIDALRAAAGESRDLYEREHVTPFVWRRPERFSAIHLACIPDRRKWRLTVDTKEDYALAGRVYDELFETNPLFGLTEITSLFARNPGLLELNDRVSQKPLIGLDGEDLSSS
jgi:spore coat polysaccharide biosynthesis protein SpsF